ncbi:hypothetical protein ACLH0K_15365 [Arthrobacter sp. MPF02]|uniref:hypothetical protein n=1 Tax=Arthrobacter sp. MPF02 TaxID=3388492 RepID=UPI0039855F6A
MQEGKGGSPHDSGPHLHAHSAITTGQMRTIGQRRREAEEKLDQHLQEAHHRSHPDEGNPEQDNNPE